MTASRCYAHTEIVVVFLVFEIVSCLIIFSYGVGVMTRELLGKCSPMLSLPFYTYQDRKFKQYILVV